MMGWNSYNGMVIQLLWLNYGRIPMVLELLRWDGGIIAMVELLLNCYAGIVVEFL